jgi:Protein of unknown function (DUF2934)/HNH endonuclease
VLPTEHEIRECAYYRWLARGCKHGQDLDDWMESEHDLTISMNYRLICRYLLDGVPKGYVPVRDREPRTCRYCGKGRPDVTFGQVAHAIPEFLGNRSVLSWDECDACNQFFSETAEDNLAKLTLPNRNLLSISGKRGVPSYKSPDQTVRSDFDAPSQSFSIFDGGPSRTFVHDEERGEVRTALECQPYVPLAALRCFSKMALAVMPEDELRHFRATRAWVLEPDYSRQAEMFEGQGCYLCLLPHPAVYVKPWAALLRLTDLDTPLFYMIFVLGTGRLLYQTHVPLCDLDNRLIGQTITAPRSGYVAEVPLEGASWRYMRLGSPVVAKGRKINATIKINHFDGE